MPQRLFYFFLRMGGASHQFLQLTSPGVGCQVTTKRFGMTRPGPVRVRESRQEGTASDRCQHTRTDVSMNSERLVASERALSALQADSGRRVLRSLERQHLGTLAQLVQMVRP